MSALKPVKKLKRPPFKVGDKVRTNWNNRGKPHWETTLLAVYPGDSDTGWLAVGAAVPPCATCGHVAHPQTPPLSTLWFEKL